MLQDSIYIPLHAGIKGTNKPNIIVLHAISEFIYDEEDHEYLYCIDLLKKKGLSVHAFITPTGTIIRSVSAVDVAYHAKGYNKDSLGVEFMVPGFNKYEDFIKTMETDWTSKNQIDSGKLLIRYWLDTNKINKIVTHHELSPERKFDPGYGFPIQIFKDML